MKIMESFMKVLPFLTELIALVVALIPVFTQISKVMQGQRCQLRNDMLQIYYHNKDTGKIRQYEYENFVLLYEAYKALKGNSFIDKIYDEVKKWEIIT
jgi:hypothetical protein